MGCQSFWGWSIAGAMLLAACSSNAPSDLRPTPSGGASSTLPGGDGSPDLSGNCSGTSEQSVDETYVLPDGSTVGQRLAWISGPHRALLDWQPAQDITVSPDTGTTELLLTATPDPSTTTFWQSPIPYCGLPVFGVSAGIRVVTADGGFDESWTVALGTELRSQYPEDSAASFSVDLRRTVPQGSFSVTYTGTVTWDSESLILVGRIGSTGTHGNVTYTGNRPTATDPNGGGGFGLLAEVATWAPSPDLPDAG